MDIQATISKLQSGIKRREINKQLFILLAEKNCEQH